MDQKKIEKAFSEIIEALGEKEYIDNLKETPNRIAKSYEEIFFGVGKNPLDILKNTIEINSRELILQKDIDFYSICEHHFLPFFGKISIAYVPNGKIFGFGDIIKLIEILSRRPQLQEKLTEEIAIYLEKILNCAGVYVKIEAKHLCMTMRGVKKENALIITTSSKGCLKEIDKKNEVLALLRG